MPGWVKVTVSVMRHVGAPSTGGWVITGYALWLLSKNVRLTASSE